MSSEKPKNQVTFLSSVTFSDGSALQSGDHAKFEYRNESTAGFASELQAVHTEVIARHFELEQTVLEALGNILRQLAHVRAADATHVAAKLKELEDEHFLREVLPQLRPVAVNWDAILTAARTTGETAKALRPLLELLMS